MNCSVELELILVLMLDRSSLSHGNISRSLVHLNSNACMHAQCPCPSSVTGQRGMCELQVRSVGQTCWRHPAVTRMMSHCHPHYSRMLARCLSVALCWWSSPMVMQVVSIMSNRVLVTFGLNCNADHHKGKGKGGPYAHHFSLASHS